MLITLKLQNNNVEDYNHKESKCIKIVYDQKMFK